MTWVQGVRSGCVVHHHGRVRRATNGADSRRKPPSWTPWWTFVVNLRS